MLCSCNNSGFCKACKTKAYKAEYNQRPEVKARAAEQSRDRRKRPEVKAWLTEYHRRPEVKAKAAERRQKPEVKAKLVEYNRTRRYANLRVWASCILSTSRQHASKGGYAPLDSDIDTLVLLRETFEAEIGCCYSCKKKISFSAGRGLDSAVVEHCHMTGKLRGVTCRGCNQGISYIEGPNRSNLEHYLADFG